MSKSNLNITSPNYPERVYAGILGKIIGVYLGRPIEGWNYQRIESEFGEVNEYVHARLDLPLLVTDDDLSGTFTFIRALEDYNFNPDITCQQIGQTWLNYLIENQTTLWWGGLGNSTEHTAYLRLKHGIMAPASGSMERNGKRISEQIGAQIFIDGWALISPGDPEKAASFARRAASVSHDGEAVHAACLWAAMEAQAFVETDFDCLLDIGLGQISTNSVIYQMIQDVRQKYAKQPDWRLNRNWILETYGTGEYAGVCHIVPNQALMINALLHGQGDFQKSLMIVNTSGEDTDCNSGNLGCLLGIRNGLAAFQGLVDWRGPVADRLYLSTADGGGAITDAARETYRLIRIAYGIQGKHYTAPKAGARFHFEFPGSVQGFSIQPVASGNAWLENVVGHSVSGERSLAIRYKMDHGSALEISTPTFIPPETILMPGYNLEASPTLYPGQCIRVGVLADAKNTESLLVRIILNSYGPDDVLMRTASPVKDLYPGKAEEILWELLPDTPHPIATVGLEVRPGGTETGSIYLDYLTWDGAPQVTLSYPAHNGSMWERAWVKGVDGLFTRYPRSIRIVQNEGRGLLIQGSREWRNYRVEGEVVPHLMHSGGICACVQGMQRYYALCLTTGNKIVLMKALDGLEVLAERDFSWSCDRPYRLGLEVHRSTIVSWLDGEMIFAIEDLQQPLIEGAVALICEEGCISTDALRVSPLSKRRPSITHGG